MAGPPDALDKVQFVAVRMTFPIEPGFVVETNRINHERIPFPLADRVPHPRGNQILGMLPSIHEDLAHKVIVLEEHEHAAGNLNDLERLSNSHKVDSRHSGRKTLE